MNVHGASWKFLPNQGGIDCESARAFKSLKQLLLFNCLQQDYSLVNLHQYQSIMVCPAEFIAKSVVLVMLLTPFL